MSPIKRKFFVACLGLAVAVALFSGVFAVMGWGSLLGQVGATVMYPFQWLGDKVGDGIAGFGRYFDDLDELRAELESLKEENESLKSDLLDAEILRDESRWLYEYLSMKEAHGDYALCAATVVTSTSAGGTGGDHVTELTLNKGTADGVETGMPVVTTAGLVGVVVEVGVNYSRVSTILDPSVSVGAVTTRASENGLCIGDYSLVHDGLCVVRHMGEEADVTVEDIVVTSGRGSVYPYGIPIGRVERVASNAFSRTTEATVDPFVDFSDLTRVVVMTEYIHYVDGFETGGAP